MKTYCILITVLEFTNDANPRPIVRSISLPTTRANALNLRREIVEGVNTDAKHEPRKYPRMGAIMHDPLRFTLGRFVPAVQNVSRAVD